MLYPAFQLTVDVAHFRFDRINGEGLYLCDFS